MSTPAAHETQATKPPARRAAASEAKVAGPHQALARGPLLVERPTYSPLHLLVLQRLAGNEAVTLMLMLQRQQAPPATADPAIEKAVRSGNPMDIAAIPDYSRASEVDRVKFIEILVGETSEAISSGQIIRVWRSFPDDQFQRVVIEHRGLWDRCVTRFGGDPFVIVPTALADRLKGEYEKAIEQLATENVKQNEGYVDTRMQQMGLKPGGDAKPLTAEAMTELRHTMQALAWDVWSMRRS